MVLPPVVNSREVKVVEFVRQVAVLFGGVGLTSLDLFNHELDLSQLLHVHQSTHTEGGEEVSPVHLRAIRLVLQQKQR